MKVIYKSMIILLICFTGMVNAMNMANMVDRKRSLEQSLNLLESERCLLEGKLYFYEEDGIKRDYAKAFECFSEVARKEDVQVRREASYLLGVMHFGESYGAVDYEKSLSWFCKVVDEGGRDEIVSCANYGIGLIYYKIKQDYERACEYFKKGLYQEVHKTVRALSFARLGRMYLKGQGVEVNYEKAKDYLKKSSEQIMSKEAQALSWNNQGVLYENGYGVAQDYVKAREYYEKAVGQDASREAQAVALKNLGVLYENGWGVFQDYVKAREYYEKAAGQDASKEIQALALICLGTLYATGHGVAQNYVKAREYYEKAAAQKVSKEIQESALKALKIKDK